MLDIWRPGVPLLKLRVYQFEHLLLKHLPKLHDHFISIHLLPDYFASQWFLTLFAYSASHEVVVRIWDILINEGWKTVFRFGIGTLKLMEKELLSFDLEVMSMFLKKYKVS
jgi:hypothetical protein